MRGTATTLTVRISLLLFLPSFYEPGLGYRLEQQACKPHYLFLHHESINFGSDGSQPTCNKASITKNIYDVKEKKDWTGVLLLLITRRHYIIFLLSYLCVQEVKPRAVYLNEIL